MEKKLLSIILPVYNEEKNIPVVYKELKEVLQKLHHYHYEVLFVNDGSTDESLEKLKEIRGRDDYVKVINFSRNFGNQAAVACGFHEAKGDFIITMDSDLQDPPELIPKMLKKAEKGIDIVYTRITKRNDGFMKKLTANFYYFLFDKFGSVKIPRHTGDYRLINKKILNVINRCNERARFLRGLIAWSGFTHDFVEFERPKRGNGIPGYTWKKLMKLALDGFTGFSFFPLKLSAFIGVFVIITSILMFLYVTYDAIVVGNHYPLYKWLVIFVYGFMGVQFILMWLLGEYIGRIYDEQRKRPMYIIDEDLD